jgi:hypothetical protein
MSCIVQASLGAALIAAACYCCLQTPIRALLQACVGYFDGNLTPALVEAAGMLQIVRTCLVVGSWHSKLPRMNWLLPSLPFPQLWCTMAAGGEGCWRLPGCICQCHSNM